VSTEYVERSTAMIGRIEGGEIRPVEAAFVLDRAVVEQLRWEAQ
jgi:hypothetical protein